MKTLVPVVLSALLITACTSNKRTEVSESSDAIPAEEIVAVCISNGVPIREYPRKDGKWTSSMNLGETAIYLGETVADSTDKVREFHKLKLSDGTSQWTRSYGIILGAKPAAVVKKTPIYKRPELVTKTDRFFGPAEFLVVVNEKNEWVEVIGAEKRKKGWIHKNVLSLQNEDIAIATLAHKSLLDKNGNILPDKLGKFLEDLPYQDAQLVVFLQQLLHEQVETAIEESIIEYEEQMTTGDSEEEI